MPSALPTVKPVIGMELADFLIKQIKEAEMSDTIKMTKLFDLPEGAAYSVRIVNNTGDYIDFTNYGARLLDIFVHTPGGGMSNICNKDITPDKECLDSHPETLS